jgi:hypothetical protein
MTPAHASDILRRIASMIESSQIADPTDVTAQLRSFLASIEVVDPSIRIAKKRRKLLKTDDILEPKTEFSCQVELSLTADFEGMIPKDKLLKKLKAEIVSALQVGVETTAREYHLKPTGIHVRPIRVECAVSDAGLIEDEIDSEVSES